MTASVSNEEVPLGEGGPLRRLEARCRLTCFHRQLVAAALLTWIPVVVLGLASEHLSGRPNVLVHDTAMHVRLLVATPVLLFLDRVFPTTCQYALGALTAHGFIPSHAEPQFARTLQRVRRLDNWWAPEAVLAALAMCFGIAVLLRILPVSGLTAGRTEAHVWYALVALPFYEFLVLRSLWRWALWVGILVGASRTSLQLEPMHPDRRGGLAMLCAPSLNYCALMLFAISSVLCADWGGRFPAGVTLVHFVPLLLAFGAVGTLLAFGPLLVFTPQLVRTRRSGKSQLGGMAAQAARWLRKRWTERPAEDVVTSTEVQSLAAVISAYRDTTAQIAVLVFGKHDLLLGLAATLAPVVPLMLVRIPRADLVAMAGLFTGGFP